MFESQTNLAKAIQAQGTILASGQQSGQSMMLTLDQAEESLGLNKHNWMLQYMMLLEHTV